MAFRSLGWKRLRNWFRRWFKPAPYVAPPGPVWFIRCEDGNLLAQGVRHDGDAVSYRKRFPLQPFAQKCLVISRLLGPCSVVSSFLQRFGDVTNIQPHGFVLEESDTEIPLRVIQPLLLSLDKAVTTDNMTIAADLTFFYFDLVWEINDGVAVS
jgi:hypothetical protein